MLDSLRLAVGTLTIAPVPPPRRLDRVTAGHAMLWAPLVGAGVGAIAAIGLEGTRWLLRKHALGSLLAAVIAVGIVVVLTRALHLDGLADTADGLGSGRPAPEALEVMRRSDVGPFGVVTLVLVLLLQTTALVIAVEAGRGWLCLVVSAATGRLAATWACTRQVPAARTTGLGATVASSVPVLAAVALTVATVAVASGVATLDDDASLRLALRAGAAVLLGLGTAMLLLRHCVRRLGGITGDVLGALVETGVTAALVAFVISL